MRLRFSFVFVLALLPGLVQALGLGALDLDSGLNEPFEARIELISATADELESLNILLADQEAFQRAGISRELILTQLRFEVSESETGPDYIRIYSSDPIREPFLNFLLEISWSKGRLFREYTVLIDPPIYAPEQQQKTFAQPTKPPAAVEEMEDQVVVYEPAYKESKPSVSAPSAREIDYSGGDYGPTVTGDTLWSLAKAMRPDSSVSIQQTMLALLRTNPEAFINSNINGLRRGHVLRMAEMTDIQSVAKEEAFEQAKTQNSLWEEARTAIAAAVTPRPGGTGTALEEEIPGAEEEEVDTTASETPAVTTAEEVESPVVAPKGEPELRLVPVPEKGEGMESAAGSAATEATNKALEQELAVVNESLEALAQENAELTDKLSETEAIIGDLKRLIVLKEEELAALQQHVAKTEAEKAAAAKESAEKASKAAITAKEEIEEAPVEEITKEPVVSEKPVKETEAIEKAGVAVEPAVAEEKVEPVVAEEAKETGKAAVTEQAESAVEKKPAPVPEPVKEEESSGIISSILSFDMTGIVDQLKSNMMFAGIFGVLLLITFLVLFSMRRQSEEAIEIPQSAFPDFDDFDVVTAQPEISEDVTDINKALRDSEDETILPGDEDETVQPDAQADKTRIISPSGGPSAAPVEEKDPMEEVNYFLAYEQWDQAADFVKQAIAKEPDNLEFHTKLLEVYYAAGNKKGYETAAEVLHDKVGGRGEHWSIALAMWQELSPNRALFQTPVGGEEEEAGPVTGGGIVNIAGDAGQVAGSLDFDLEATAEKGEDLLNITAADEGQADILDVTVAIDIEDDDVLNVSSAISDEEVLDISQAGGDIASPAKADDGSIDFTLDSVSEEDNSLDISREGSDNLLDVTFAGGPDKGKSDDALELMTDSDESILDVSHSGDDLLDVTSTTDFKPEGQDDLLDVTAARNVEVDGGLLDIDMAESAEQPPLMTSAPKAADDNVIEFDIGVPGDNKPETDAREEAGMDFELSPDDAPESAVAGDDGLTFDIGLDISSQATGEIPKGGLDLELQIDEESEKADDLIDLDKTMEIPKPKVIVDKSMDILKAETDMSGALEFESPEVDMEGTVAMPYLEIDESEDGDGGSDRTVIVPRTSGTGEQSAEDEIATQLDLAKAYVELGDNDNARTILDEIIAIGNSEQRQQAQELLGQIR